jgi:hypothetical protein
MVPMHCTFALEPSQYRSRSSIKAKLVTAAQVAKTAMLMLLGKAEPHRLQA